MGRHWGAWTPAAVQGKTGAPCRHTAAGESSREEQGCETALILGTCKELSCCGGCCFSWGRWWGCGARCQLHSMGQASLFQGQESHLPPIPAPPGSCRPHLPPQLHLPAPDPSTAEPPAPASPGFAYGAWSLEPANCQEKQEPAAGTWQCGAFLGNPRHLSPGTQSFRAVQRTRIHQNRAALSPQLLHRHNHTATTATMAPGLPGV